MSFRTMNCRTDTTHGDRAAERMSLGFRGLEFLGVPGTLHPKLDFSFLLLATLSTFGSEGLQH